MDKILEFIELQDTISYNQSFDLALKCSRLIASGTEEELVMARKIIIRVLDELKKIPKETYDIWSDLVEAVGFYPYLEKNKKILEQNSLAEATHNVFKFVSSKWKYDADYRVFV